MSESTNAQIFNEKCGMVASIGMSLLFLLGAAITGSTISSSDKPQDATHNEAPQEVDTTESTVSSNESTYTTILLLAASGLFSVAALNHRNNAKELQNGQSTPPKGPTVS